MDVAETGMRFEAAMAVVSSHAEGRLLAGQIDKVGVILFNQPQKRNAMSLEMWDGVCDTLDHFSQDPEVRVVIYAGTGGKAFMAGSDISQFAGRRDNAEGNAEFMRLSKRGRDRMQNFSKPSIACIEGFCIGGGMVTAMDADIRVASAGAVFGITAARLGLHYGIEPTEKLVSLIGPSRARLVLYTARRFSAREALDMGLVDVVAVHDVVRESLDLAHAIAGNAPLSVLASKFTIGQALKPVEARDLAALQEQTRRCMDSADYREGRAAFAEKRNPVFRGA